MAGTHLLAPLKNILAMPQWIWVSSKYSVAHSPVQMLLLPTYTFLGFYGNYYANCITN